MSVCETCGNAYERPMEIVIRGHSHTFDSFQCAIQALAPTCPHCGCRVIGHGVDGEGEDIFCCRHCAEASGIVVS